jgi:hypothetical protein
MVTVVVACAKRFGGRRGRALEGTNMKVFVSWSGDQSRKVGEELKRWLRCVLQAVQPWFSPEDLGKGQPWAHELVRQLHEVKVGVFCLTPGNISAPWIAFEAAACMVKTEGRVFTYLHGIAKPTDVTGPLAIFNHSIADREGTLRLVADMNKLLPEPLPDDVLKATFNNWWPALESALAKIPALPPTQRRPSRDPAEVAEETLQIARELQGQIGHVAHYQAQLHQQQQHERDMRRSLEEELIRLRRASADDVAALKRNALVASMAPRLERQDGMTPQDAQMCARLLCGQGRESAGFAVGLSTTEELELAWRRILERTGATDQKSLSEWYMKREHS